VRRAADTGDDAFVLLGFEALLPPLRGAVLNAWEPRDPEPLLTLLEAWERALPAPARAQLLDACVMPKLRAAVDGWDPRRDTLPIHAWLHPWLPLLGPQLAGLYPAIRQRLTGALGAWHPSDGSALALLGPWRAVFEPADWEALMARSIAPKLAGALGELVINPLAQDLNPIAWVLAWSEALPPRQMVGLLEAGFFPKWHAVLHHWLTAGGGAPDYDEVTRWYLGWRGLFPPSLADHERVRAQFNHALNTMNRAVDGAPLAPPPGAAAAGVAGAGAAGAAPPPPPSRPAPPAAELTLRDLVARFAEEHDVAFAPKAGRSQEGLPVYAFGAVSVALDSKASVVRAQLRERWAPVSLERLLEEHRARSGGGANG